ncbi:RNA-binding protein 42-like [Mustela lutreola]|uniref:RNA-binding protein 42-like n=1 Tax=Mustela lutreola TaxID=9666 RepID=UPI00279762F2|nr:RNA-binding protein 42-like [Mustela lutreola]XP_059008144.1 RNA-binding protein 42-like [Mustela lutreola]
MSLSAPPCPSLPLSLIGRWPLLAPPLDDVRSLPSESRHRGGGIGRGNGSLLSWRREACRRGGGHSPAQVAAGGPGLRRGRAPGTAEVGGSAELAGDGFSGGQGELGVDRVVAGSYPSPFPSLPPLAALVLLSARPRLRPPPPPPPPLPPRLPLALTVGSCPRAPPAGGSRQPRGSVRGPRARAAEERIYSS